jgi:hypothetical protein
LLVSSSSPTRVVLYTLLSGDWQPGAEFHYAPEDGVTLVVHDPKRGGTIAQKYYDRGVPNDEERRLVTRDEPEVFMRTLLQPSRTTYYRWVDESQAASDGDEGTRGIVH